MFAKRGRTLSSDVDEGEGTVYILAYRREENGGREEGCLKTDSPHRVLQNTWNCYSFIERVNQHCEGALFVT